MAQKYDDDEVVTEVPPQHDLALFEGGKITAKCFNNNDAPLTETNFTLLIKLIGSKETVDRAGLDLVLVLDVSGSMRKDDRIGHLKTATKFLIRKLTPIDRLSVVTFSSRAQRLCPLRQMNDVAQSEIEFLITSLNTRGTTNMTMALEEAVKVVNDRRLTAGREVAIMLMSDGEPYPKGADGSQIDFENVPVYTFGLGQDCDHRVLIDIACRSKLGTFSMADVGSDGMSSLGVAFSQCLAGLMTVTVQDLTLTIQQQPGSKILNVFAGRYPMFTDESDESVTISFGNLYSKEMRNILVDLVLPEVNDSIGVDILKFSYSYKVPETQEVFGVLPLFVTISRTQFVSTEGNLEVSLEKARQQTAEKMREAMRQADGYNFEGAIVTISEAQNYLMDNNDAYVLNPNIKDLISELSQFLKFLESPEIYMKLGRAFVTAALLSHALQRFASRGNANEQRMFATDAMNLFSDQVHQFENNPDYEVPAFDQDVDELRKATTAGCLSVHFEEAILCLKAIQRIIEELK